MPRALSAAEGARVAGLTIQGRWSWWRRSAVILVGEVRGGLEVPVEDRIAEPLRLGEPPPRGGGDARGTC